MRQSRARCDAQITKLYIYKGRNAPNDGFLPYIWGRVGLFSTAVVEVAAHEKVQTKGKIYNFYDLGEVIHVEQHLNRRDNEFSHWATTMAMDVRDNARPERLIGHS